MFVVQARAVKDARCSQHWIELLQRKKTNEGDRTIPVGIELRANVQDREGPRGPGAQGSPDATV